MSMGIQIIEVKKQQLSSQGSYAKYYQIDKDTGVKVLSCEGYKTVKDLFNSKKWVDNLLEYVYYHQAQDTTKMSPQNIVLVIVKKSKRFYPGISMEHIEGTAYEDFRRMGMTLFVTPKGKIVPNREKNSKELMSYVKKRLDKKAKIKYLDNNFQNFIIESSGRVRVIDFTPQLCIMEGLF